MSIYAFEGPKWQSTTITWAFAAFNYTSDDPFSSPISGVYQADIQNAFARWSAVSGLSLVQMSDSSNPATAPDIRVGFEFLNTRATNTIGLTYLSGSQFLQTDVTVRMEDPSELPIINQGGTLTYNGYGATLYQVALHEIGHALGLDHSTDPAAVMYPTSTANNRDLNASDVAGIQALYGFTSGLQVPPTPPPAPVAFNGTSSQYQVADIDGSYIVRDTVGGRDGTQTIPTGAEAVFTDGVGVFDPTGTAEAVARLYEAVLGRAPDIAGLSGWTAQIDNGHVPLSAVANGFLTSMEFIQVNGISLSDDAFVQKLYLNVLDRPADAAGEQDWDSALAAGASRGQVAVGFAESTEERFRTLSIAGEKNDAEAYRLYKAALARAPDLPGQDAWSAALSLGQTPTQAAQGFIDSPEFQQKYGSLTSTDFVVTLYRNALGREPDAGGLQDWVNALQGGSNRGSVLLGFSDSLENRLQTSNATHDGWVFIPS